MSAASSPSTSHRAPIVTIMGHVDHGKTTLLDAIRESRLTAAEEGGITQHIGAYQVTYQSKPITFIDTPGHAAFSEMRSRGAQVTDIVILVVAADDGVKPQTVESIKHIKSADAPLIVAINKIDAPGASVDMVKAQLTEHEVFVEGYGGQTPAVEISALQKKGIDQLLEMVLLMADLEELEADFTGPFSAVVIESHVDKRQGPLATLIVKNGLLEVGSQVFVGQDGSKIKALFNDLGKRIKKAGPSTPVAVMGFREPPPVGSLITSEPSEITPDIEAMSSADSSSEVSSESDNKINLIIKADTAGTLEAILHSVLQPEIQLIASDVGPVAESDVLLADTTKSLIIAFNTPITSAAKKLSTIEKVEIVSFNIIYKLLEYLEEKVLTVIEPTINEIEHGEAVVKTRFDIRGQIIAGCLVTSGSIHKNHLIHLVRNDKIIKDASIKSLKQAQVDISEVKAGSECGIVLEPALDIKVDDVLKSYSIQK